MDYLLLVILIAFVPQENGIICEIVSLPFLLLHLFDQQNWFYDTHINSVACLLLYKCLWDIHESISSVPRLNNRVDWVL